LRWLFLYDTADTCNATIADTCDGFFYTTLLTLAMPPSLTLAKAFVSKEKPHSQEKSKNKRKN
jgi:hypothetical protein